MVQKKKFNCDYESVFPKKTLLLLPDASSQNDFSLANFFGLGPIITFLRLYSNTFLDSERRSYMAVDRRRNLALVIREF